MKFTIAKETICLSLKSAASVAGRTTSLPILSHVRLSAGMERLTVYATDLEMGFEARHEADVQEPGAICLPARILHNIITSLPDGPVEFTTDDRLAVTIRSAPGFYKIQGLGPDDFPRGVDLADIVLLPVQAADLRTLIHTTLYAVSTDTTRVPLCGVFLKWEADKLITVATDGQRMAKAVRSVVAPELTGFAGKGVIIPRRALQELLHILEKRLDIQVLIGVAGGLFILRVSGEALTFHVNLIDADYPDYGRVLPKALTTPVVVCRAALLESLQRLNILAGEFGILDLDLAGATLRLTVDDPDLGSASEDHPVRNSGNNACAVRVDIRLLRSAAEVTHEDEIIIDLAMENHPIQIMNASAREVEDKEYVGIVMPLKIE
jgi:DNA polymerase-3 subunit beta